MLSPPRAPKSAAMLGEEMETSPPTISPRSDSVEKALARHRRALEEIRNSNFDSVPALNLSSKLSGRVVFRDDHEDDRPAIDAHTHTHTKGNRATTTTSTASRAALRDLVTWKNPAASVLALLGGSFVYAFLRSGSITTLLCYLLLSRVGWHVLSAIFSKQGADTRLVDSFALEQWSAASTALVGSLAQLHDDYIVTADTQRSVAVCAGLWALSLAGKCTDLLTLAYAAYLSAFVLPNLGHIPKELLGDAALRIKHSTPAVVSQMSTKQRRLSIVAVAASLWISFDWANRVIGLLMALLCVRMTMTQTEVDKLREVGAPLTMSVKKKAARMSRRVSFYLGGTAEKQRRT